MVDKARMEDARGLVTQDGTWQVHEQLMNYLGQISQVTHIMRLGWCQQEISLDLGVNLSRTADDILNVFPEELLTIIQSTKVLIQSATIRLAAVTRTCRAWACWYHRQRRQANYFAFCPVYPRSFPECLAMTRSAPKSRQTRNVWTSVQVALVRRRIY